MSLNVFIQKIIRAAQSGEESAWESLYQYYHPKLSAAAFRICGASPEIKDLVQDSFITAYLKLDQLKDPAHFESWIRKILQRNCYRLLNKKRLKTEIDLLTLPDSNEAETYVEKKFDQALLQKRLYTALSQLNDGLLSALLLRYFSSYSSYLEIAEILSLPIGTVRSRLNEGKVKLTEKWRLPLNEGTEKEAEYKEWNSFYFETFSGLHYHDDAKKRFFNHLDKNVRIVFPRRQLFAGRRVFENMIIDDHNHGSWLIPEHIVSSGNISIIESNHFNSSEHPHHCPRASIILLSRREGLVDKLHLYASQ